MTANPDGNLPNYVYDNNANPLLCPTTVTTISASISDPSGLSTVELFVRYYDGQHPPTNYTNVGPTFNSGTQKYEKAIDYPLDAIGPDPASIQYFWEAFDNSPQHNVTVAPPVNPNVVPIVDCQGIIP
jgi:hypothetical protein